MRVVHYLNQFFGGVGGEERAGMRLEEREGAAGPGRLLEQLLGGNAKIVKTLVCGDNYAVEHQDEVIASVLKKVQEAKAELFIAGPCFEAGRQGGDRSARIGRLFTPGTYSRRICRTNGGKAARGYDHGKSDRRSVRI